MREAGRTRNQLPEKRIPAGGTDAFFLVHAAICHNLQILNRKLQSVYKLMMTFLRHFGYGYRNTGLFFDRLQMM